MGLLVNVCVGAFCMSECLVVRSAHVDIKCRFLRTSLNKLNFDLKKSQIIFIADSGRWLGLCSGRRLGCWSGRQSGCLSSQSNYQNL